MNVGKKYLGRLKIRIYYLLKINYFATIDGVHIFGKCFTTAAENTLFELFDLNSSNSCTKSKLHTNTFFCMSMNVDVVSAVINGFKNYFFYPDILSVVRILKSAVSFVSKNLSLATISISSGQFASSKLY